MGEDRACVAAAGGEGWSIISGCLSCSVGDDVWLSMRNPGGGAGDLCRKTRGDGVTGAQTTTNGVTLAVKISRRGRDGQVLSSDEGVFLVALRDGTWKVQARSMMGT